MIKGEEKMDGTIRDELENNEEQNTAILEQRIREMEKALQMERENSRALEQIFIRTLGKLTGVIQ